MNKKSTAILGSLALLAMLPFVSAFSGTYMGWSLETIALDATNTVHIGVGSGNNTCPPGQTFSGVVTVTSPNGGKAGYYVSAPCGAIVSAVYPNSFVGGGSTNIAGTYTASFVGSTSTPGQNFHFTITDAFVVNSFGVPQ